MTNYECKTCNYTTTKNKEFVAHRGSTEHKQNMKNKKKKPIEKNNVKPVKKLKTAKKVKSSKVLDTHKCNNCFLPHKTLKQLDKHYETCVKTARSPQFNIIRKYNLYDNVTYVDSDDENSFIDPTGKNPIRDIPLVNKTFSLSDLPKLEDLEEFEDEQPPCPKLDKTVAQHEKEVREFIARCDDLTEEEIERIEFCERLLYEHKNGTLAKFIGDMILAAIENGDIKIRR